MKDRLEVRVTDTNVYGDDGVAKNLGDKAMRYIAEETYKKVKIKL